MQLHTPVDTQHATHACKRITMHTLISFFSFQVIFLLAEGRDITAKKQADAELEKKNHEV